MPEQNQPTPLDYMMPAPEERRWSTAKTLVALALTIASYGMYRFLFEVGRNGVLGHSLQFYIFEIEHVVALALGVGAILACIAGIARAKSWTRWLFLIPILLTLVTAYSEVRDLRFLLIGA